MRPLDQDGDISVGEPENLEDSNFPNDSKLVKAALSPFQRREAWRPCLRSNLKQMTCKVTSILLNICPYHFSFPPGWWSRSGLCRTWVGNYSACPRREWFIGKNCWTSLICTSRKQDGVLRWILRMLDQVGKTTKLDRRRFIFTRVLTHESGFNIW